MWNHHVHHPYPPFSDRPGCKWCKWWPFVSLLGFMNLQAVWGPHLVPPTAVAAGSSWATQPKKRPRLVGFRLNEDKKNRCHKHIHPAQTNGLYFNLIQLNLDSDGVGTPNSHHPPRKAKNMASQCSMLSQEVIFGIKEASRGWEIVPCLLLKLAIVPKGIPHILGQ